MTINGDSLVTFDYCPRCRQNAKHYDNYCQVCGNDLVEYARWLIERHGMKVTIEPIGEGAT